MTKYQRSTARVVPARLRGQGPQDVHLNKGEIVVGVDLENAGDRVGFEQGLRDESSIRRTRVNAVVDTSAAMLVLPQNVVERLGLASRRAAVVPYAGERKEERPVAGPVTVEVCDRFMITSASSVRR